MNQPQQSQQPAAAPIDWKKCRISRTGNILTPKCRLSWPTLMVPEANRLNPTADKSYSVMLLIPPGCDLTLLKEDARRAATAKFGAALPTGLKLPFRDAAAIKGMSDFVGWTAISVATKEKRGRPSCADASGKAIEPTPEEAYGGRWACVSVKAWAYDKAGNRGVSFGLQSVQLLDHDEPIAGSRVNAEEEFAPVEGAAGIAATNANDIFA